MQGYNNWNIVRKYSVLCPDISWFSPFYSVRLCASPFRCVASRPLWLSAQLHSRLIYPLTLYVTSGRGRARMTDRQTYTAQTDGRSGWLNEAARDGSVIVKACSHTLAPLLSISLPPCVLAANKQINNNNGRKTKTSDETCRRVSEEPERGRHVGVARLLRRSQMRANVFDMHFTRRTT